MNLTTPQTLSADTVERYRSQGFVHIPRVLSEDEVHVFLADAREQLERQQKVSWDEEGRGNVMDWVADIELKSESMRRLALHPRITGIAERLAGRALRMFKTELLLKRTTGATRTPFHVDDPVFPIAGAPVTLTAWVALVDVPVERGCMGFIPRSQVWPAGSTPDSRDVFAVRPELTWWPRATVPLPRWPRKSSVGRSRWCQPYARSGSGGRCSPPAPGTPAEDGLRLLTGPGADRADARPAGNARIGE